MPKTKKTTKYLVPTVFAAVLVCALVMGVLYIRTYLMKQTIQERSYQLEEMVSQIQVNLNYGLETHWNLVTAIETAAEGKHLGDEQELCRAISETERDHRTDLYGCRIMLIDEIGTAYIDDGAVGIWDDISRLSDGEEHHTFISDTSNVDGTFLAFAQKLDDPITVGADEKRFTHLVLLKEIETLKKYYTTETYGGNAATYIIKKNGTMAYYDADDDDIFGVRNIFKALEEAEYIQDTNFNAIKDRLESDGIATANIMLGGTEYYYCLTTIDTYDMTLMLLIPAEYVAVSTMDIYQRTDTRKAA